MEQIYHYTSESNWEKIKEGGILMPKSGPFDSIDDIIAIPQRVKEIVTFKNYLVGIPPESLNKWIEYGLMDYVVDHISKKTPKKVMLKVPIFNKEEAFVREHKFMSPKYFINSYEEDLWKKLWNCEISEEEDFRTKDSLIKYIESTTRLSDYKGQFEVPEVWIPQETPIDKLELVVN